MPKISSFIVTGKGRFPVDMLRYDRCYPRDGESANAIFTPVEQRSALRVLHLNTDKPGSPTYGRWASFGWSVSLCYDAEGNEVVFSRL